MKRIYTIYGLFLLAILITGLVGIRLSRITGVHGAIRKLGGGEGAYRQARYELVLGSDNPVMPLGEFITDPETPDPARVHALRILGEIAAHQAIDTVNDAIAAQLSSTSPEVRSAALEALGKSRSPKGIETVTDVFLTAVDTATFQAAFRCLEQMVEPIIDTVHKAIAQRDTTLLDRYRPIIEHTPVDKAKMFLALSKFYKDLGNYEKAAAYYRRLGYIKHWWVIGGWENRKMRQFYEVAPPETTTFRPDTAFVLRDSLTAAWTRIARLGDYRQSIDLRNVLVKTKYCVAYMLTFLHADSARDALMFYGSDDGVKVWCNDSLVHAKKVYRAIYIDDDVFRLRLHKGVNTLLVKVLQDVGGWGLSPRVVGADGEAIPGLRVSYADTLEPPNVLKPYLDRMAGGTEPSDSDLAGINHEDRAVVAELLATLSDDAAPAARKRAALRILRYVNQRREVPVGERACIALAERQIASGRYDRLTVAVLEALTAGKSMKAIDVALKARNAPDEQVVRPANDLVSSYCRMKIMTAGDLADEDRRMELSRLMNELYSLNPSCPWVRARIAFFFHLAQDSAKGATMAELARMPNAWLLTRDRYESQQQFRKRYAPMSTKRFAALWEAGGDKQWTAIDVMDNNELHAGSFVELSEIIPAQGSRSGRVTVAHTQVVSPRKQEVFLAVTVPSDCDLYLNGDRVSMAWSTTDKDYHLYGIYNRQQRNYDVNETKITLRKGINTISLGFTGNWYIRWRGYTPYFRVGFRNLRGEPLVLSTVVDQ